MSTRIALSVSLAALVGLGACAGPHDDHHHDHGSTGPSRHPAEPPLQRQLVHLDPEQLERFDVDIAEAGPGPIETTTELPGVVRVNGDHMAHVAPRVSGVVREVFATLGDRVEAGQLLAVFESRELADAKAGYLAATERLRLAEATHRREERLWRERVTSEQEFLDAGRARAEARIEVRRAEQQLAALGFSREELESLSERHDATLTTYRLTAPFAGTVIDRHITLGETVAAEVPVFTVADLSTVWIDLSIYQRDIGTVHRGQRARVSTDHDHATDLEIDVVQPLVGEDTRTALARIVAPNADGIWHPGCFITAEVSTSTGEPAAVRVPDSAVISHEDGRRIVFVETPEGFEERTVTVGRHTREWLEIDAGLEPGQRYVAHGGFLLKAELGKASFGDGHGH